MEPPLKRPRLSMFPDQGSDAELDAARYHNDMHLEIAFEAIFEKVFPGLCNVGDEVDVLTGEIVVNNGHIESMSGETDTGASKSMGSIVSGESILRAMTIAAERDDVYFDDESADDVIMSIETIAENAALTADEESSVESEDDLFDPIKAKQHSEPTASRPVETIESHLCNSERKIYFSDSDTDSLFEVQREQRLSSPDSLFDIPKVQGSGAENEISHEVGIDAEENLDDGAILAKFGNHIGQEVLELLKKRDGMTEAHIEPAWRVPIKLPPEKSSRSMSCSVTPVLIPPQRDEATSSPGKGNSIWANPRSRKPKHGAESEKKVNSVRAESEDPLQQDISPPAESRAHMIIPPQDDMDESNYTDDEVQQTDEDQEEGYEDFEDLLQKGVCPYCETQFRGRPAVMAHWTRLLRKSDSGATDDNIHDLSYMAALKGSKSRRSRGPRLTLYDFKTMVELHEGGGLTFQEIASAEVLRTQKTAATLHDLYDLHRSSQSWNGVTKPPTEWTEEENRLLQVLCSNPLVTLATLTRKLKGRKEMEIGDKLANEWLKGLRTVGKYSAGAEGNPTNPWEISPGRVHIQSGLYKDVTFGEGHGHAGINMPGLPQDSVYIKSEVSDDELFDR